MPAHKTDPTVEVQDKMCKKHGKVTQHRRYKIERKWIKVPGTDPETGEPGLVWSKTGEYRYQWRCYECVTESDLKSKEKRGVKVGAFKKAQLQKQREKSEQEVIDKSMA